ncbi:hypothetical protein Rhow_002195 [Rhodococcus wratislaviensis]|uniref:Uncharacterized protein n=1 Tax=Rhodococcus wratislaviensis TaxID=44752 RepID=A0A402C501_RHOWR|nr:hypothetical protein Rhow_002195 [Rhodococcus wratislaviensis]
MVVVQGIPPVRLPHPMRQPLENVEYASKPPPIGGDTATARRW